MFYLRQTHKVIAKGISKIKDKLASLREIQRLFIQKYVFNKKKGRKK